MLDKTFNDQNNAPKDTNSWMETAWKKFTPFELVMWTHLFTKSGTIRQEGENPEKKDIEKSVKDLHMARHYLGMLEKKITAAGIDIKTPVTATPNSDGELLATSMTAFFGSVENNPRPIVRENAARGIVSVFTTLDNNLTAAENASRPEVKAALDRQSHWKKKDKGPAV